MPWRGNRRGAGGPSLGQLDRQMGRFFQRLDRVNIGAVQGRQFGTEKINHHRRLPLSRARFSTVSAISAAGGLETRTITAVSMSWASWSIPLSIDRPPILGVEITAAGADGPGDRPPPSWSTQTGNLLQTGAGTPRQCRYCHGRRYWRIPAAPR